MLYPRQSKNPESKVVIAMVKKMLKANPSLAFRKEGKWELIVELLAKRGVHINVTNLMKTMNVVRTMQKTRRRKTFDEEAAHWREVRKNAKYRWRSKARKKFEDGDD